MTASVDLQENILLASYTTFQIGGPARWFVAARTEEDVLEAVTFAHERELPIVVLGGGSNVLVADEGFDGLVIHMELRGIQESRGVAGVRNFSVAAGENWDGFVSHAVALDCGGVECLAGIPGTVGGAPIQNVGAYGQEVSSVIRGVRALDLSSMSFVGLNPAQCGFGYRESIFNTTERGRYIVTYIHFTLDEHANPLLSYADLNQYFKDREAPTLAETVAAVREIRRRKGMLLVPGDPDCRSAGSFFKNPIVSSPQLRQIAETLHIDAGQVPQYAAAAGFVKLPAAWLLEQAGFHKGYALGAAAISSRHTLALTNRGDATAADILTLRDRIVEAVNQRFGICLEPEPVFLS
jgi:UDP-N-acetylmuramate dehydrogenase